MAATGNDSATLAGEATDTTTPSCPRRELSFHRYLQEQTLDRVLSALPEWSWRLDDCECAASDLDRALHRVDRAILAVEELSARLRAREDVYSEASWDDEIERG